MKQFSLIKHSYFRNLFLVGFYTLFFSVELFHNFEPDKRSGSSIATIAIAGKSQLQNAPSNCKKGSSHPKTNFRLNKRFQPSFIPSEFVFAPNAVVDYVQCNYFTNYSNGSLSNIFLLTKSLRAPPVV